MNHDQDQDLNLLDETLDDLADLPKQTPYPAGAYLVSMRITRAEKKPSTYIINMTHKETIELANPNTVEEEIPSEGDQSVVFIHTRKKDGTANEIGQGQLKTVLRPIAEAMETNSIGEVLEATKKGLDVIVVVKVRKDKTGQYEDSQDIVKVELPQ